MHTRSPIDPIAAIEAIYALASSEERWFADVAASLDFATGDGGAVAAGGVFQADSPHDIRVLSSWQQSTVLPTNLTQTLAAMHPADRSGTFLGPIGLLSFAEVERRMPVTGAMFRQQFTLSGFPDGGFVMARDPSGLGALFGRFCSSPLKKASSVERRRTQQLALHVGSALRLRRALAVQSTNGRQPEAVLAVDGSAQHCELAAQSPSARRVLREAVLHVDQSRTSRGRQDVDAALAGWTALIDGRWTLLERFENGGKRFFVAYENRGFISDPRGLTANERAVATRVTQGHSSKLIAYELGLSEAAVSTRLKSALKKLRLGAASELAYHGARLHSRQGGAYAAELNREGLRFEVLCVPDESGAPPVLSAAELDVSVLAAQGYSNAAIAEARGVSVRTVGNQLASAFQKLGVSSRVELAVRLTAG